MEIFLDEIKSQLAAYSDLVFYYEMTEGEILDIEVQIGKRFPRFYREFLRTFGVRQDFVFGLFRSEKDFAEGNKYLPEEIKNSFLVIGDNGGEDYWLLNIKNNRDTNIYEWQHWSNGEIVKLGYDFESLVNLNVAKLAKNETNLEPNYKKSWCVQFAITTNYEERIYSTIPLVLIQDWVLDKVSPAQVSSFVTKAKLNGKEISFRRQEHVSWSSPTYYFDIREPLIAFGKQSLIKDLDDKLKNVFPEYCLVDYGILPLTDANA